MRLAPQILLLGLVLTACGGSEPSDAPPSFTEIHERVLQPSCVFATCHESGPSPAGMLSLAANDAYAGLVEVRSSVVTAKVRVVPGDPSASYLMEKLTEAMPTAGDPMPPGAPLEDDRIELVRAWIEAGAADD